MKIFESLVRGSQGPSLVKVRVRDGIAEVLSTACNEAILVREGEEIIVSTSVMSTTDVPVSILAVRGASRDAKEGKVAE